MPDKPVIIKHYPVQKGWVFDMRYIHHVEDEIADFLKNHPKYSLESVSFNLNEKVIAGIHPGWVLPSGYLAAFILKDDRFYNYVSASKSKSSSSIKSKKCPKGTRKNKFGICEKILKSSSRNTINEN